MRKIKALSLITILVASLMATACPRSKAERPLVAFGYNYQIGILLALRTGQAFNQFGAGASGFNQPTTERLSLPQWDQLKALLKRLSLAGQDLSLAIDQTIEITPANKLQLLAEVDRYLVLIDRTALDFVTDAELKAEITRIIGIIRDVVTGVKLAISAIQINTPVGQAKAKFAEAAEKAEKKPQSRALNGELIQALGRAAGEFAAEIKAQIGLDAAALRALRDAKYLQAQAF